MKRLGLALCFWSAACSRTPQPGPGHDAGAVRRGTVAASVPDASTQLADDAGGPSDAGDPATASGAAADAGHGADAQPAAADAAAVSGSGGASGTGDSAAPANTAAPIACMTRELQPGEASMSGESPASQLFMWASPIGGRVDLHAAPDWGADDSSESVLAALTLKVNDSAPITEYLDDGSGRACVREVRFTVDVELISEDGLLDERWQAPGRLDLLSTLSLEISADVASLRGSLRDRLAMLSARGQSRIEIVFESPKTATARVFAAMQRPADGALAFEWRALCDEYFPLYGEAIWADAARDCGRLDYLDSGGSQGPETSEPSAPVYSCVRAALAANDLFGVGWRVSSGGKASYSGNISRLDALLSSSMRAPFLEMLVSAGSNVAHAQVRRCAALELQEPCSVATSGFEESGAPCFSCTDPSPWFKYCGNWR